MHPQVVTISGLRSSHFSTNNKPPTGGFFLLPLAIHYTMSQLTLLTLNVERFRFFEEIQDYIQKTNPDIIHLQEASTGPWTRPVEKRDYTTKLADACNYQYIYHPFASIEGNNALISQGVTTLSRYPIIDSFK